MTLHCIGDGGITTDPNCRVEYLNPVAESLTGWTTGEARGKPLQAIFNIVEEQSRTPAPNPVARCLKDGTIVGLVSHTVLISRHGQERAIEIGDTAEASEAIADDGAGGIEAAPGQLFHLLAPEAMTRRSFRRTGWPSGVVSMATMIGV